MVRQLAMYAAVGNRGEILLTNFVANGRCLLANVALRNSRGVLMSLGQRDLFWRRFSRKAPYGTSVPTEFTYP